MERVSGVWQNKTEIAPPRFVAICKALKLREVELCFRGKLPPETIDETSVAKNPARWEAEDVLNDRESSKALVMDMGKPLG